jgi:serine/threonine-protein kinase RsbW
LGQAAVDPAHRGRHIISQLAQCAVDEARARGLAGLYAEPVTNHTFSQQAVIVIGFRDTAIQLGFVPQSVYFKKIGDEALPQRLTLLYALLPLRTWAAVRVYVPLAHRALLERIYENLGVPRELVTSPEQIPGVSQTPGISRPEQSVLSTHVISAFDVARIEVTAYGQYAMKEVEIKLRELSRKGMACIHLDLPLSDPWTALLCTEFEALGFFLAGVVPDAEGHDVLRLQCLNDGQIAFDEIHVVSDVGQELLAYAQQATHPSPPEVA